MNLIEAGVTVATVGTAAALALNTITGVIDDITEGQWSRSVVCVERSVALHGLTAEQAIDGYLTGTIDAAVKTAVEKCVAPLVEQPDRLADLPAEVKVRLGLPAEPATGPDGAVQ